MKIRDRKFSLRALLASILIVSIASTLLTSIYFVSFIQGVRPVYPETIPSTATYTIETDNAGSYRAISSNGEPLWESADASYTVNSAISSGKRIFFKDGTFELK